MVNRLQFESLSAELSKLESLLSDAEKFDDIVGKLQLKYRIDEIQKEIASYKEGGPKASVALFFSGRPVLGSRAINADFSSAILKSFQDIVSKVNATFTIGDMGTRGRVPNANSSNLMITDVAKGSFGFVLEEVSDQEEAIDTTLKLVIDKVTRYLTGIGSLSDEEYEAILEKLDGRTLISIKDFFVTLDQNNALLRLVEGENEYQFDEGFISRARTRSESISIDEDEPSFTGRIVGILPNHRKFELEIAGGKQIYGSIGPTALKQIDEMRKNDESIVDQKWTVKMNVRVVKPLNHNERSFYTLVELIEKMEI